MKLTYSDIRRFDDKLDLILSNQAVIINQGALIMATVAELLQNMQDLRDIAQQYLDLIIAKDAANAALQQQIADLVAAANISAAEKAALQAGIDSAVADSQATEDAMRAGLPGVPPTGGTPLNLSYPSKGEFDVAVAAYTGPERVTFTDSTGTVDSKAGTDPSLDYFLHSADGSVSTTGPTD